MLPADVLLSIFDRVAPHDRRVTLPIVCRLWQHATSPAPATRALWTHVLLQASSSCQDSGALSTEEGAAHDMTAGTPAGRWLSARSAWLRELDITLPPLPSWALDVGRALHQLAPSLRLRRVSIRGPGAAASPQDGNSGSASTTSSSGTSSSSGSSKGGGGDDADPDARGAAAAGALLLGALCQASVEQVHVCGVPWAAALAALARPPPPAPSCALRLPCLRELMLTNCFYEPPANDLATAAAAAEGWAALGAALAGAPHLVRLHLPYTHAMSHVDPARGLAAAPWPPLLALTDMSLAFDLSVQPLTPLPLAGVAGVAGAAAQQEGYEPPPPPPQLPQLPPAGAAQAAGERALDACSPHSGSDSAAANDHPHPGTVTASAANAAGTNPDPDPDASAVAAALAGEGWLVVGGEASLTVDPTHAAVELLTWLPRLAALTALDLRACGLEAVPLAVAHLPALARLDLGGNPLVSLRLPGPLEALTWLRLSLDPEYDRLYGVLAAEAGEAAAAEDMMVVELHAPLLEELTVTAGSARALQCVREAAAAWPRLRRLDVVEAAGLRAGVV